MKYPEGTPAWLKEAVEQMEESSERAILTDEPAKACGYAAAVIQLKQAISGAAESEETKRMKELQALTFPKRSDA